jgi:hypothetical protein
MMVWALGPNHSFYERMGGRAITTRPIELDAVSVAEVVVLVWSDLRFTLRSGCRSRSEKRASGQDWVAYAGHYSPALHSI